MVTIAAYPDAVPLFRRGVPPLALPAQVRSGLGLARGERVLSHAMLTNGGWLVATTAALVVVDPVHGPDAGPGTPRARYLWHEVTEATWDPQQRTIDVHVVALPHQRLHLDDHDSPVPVVLRERVTSTYVCSRRIVVRARRGVVVAIRRHAVDGSLFSQAVPDEGVDLDDPRVADQVASVARELAEEAGLRL